MTKKTDREKFVVLAEKRMTRALRCLRLIGNLSNRSNYSYTDEDVKKISRALQAGVDEVRARFARRGSDKGEVFKL